MCTLGALSLRRSTAMLMVLRLTPLYDAVAIVPVLKMKHTWHAVKVNSYRTLCRSMLPDVIEESLLTHDIRREELFYAFYVLGNKFTAGFALTVSTAVYK